MTIGRKFGKIKEKLEEKKMEDRNRKAIKAAKAISEVSNLLHGMDTVACMVLVDYVLEPFVSEEPNSKRYSKDEVKDSFKDFLDAVLGEHETNELDHDDFAHVDDDDYSYRYDDDDDDYTTGCMGDI